MSPHLQYAAWLALEPAPSVPEVLLHQADDLQGLWEATGAPAPPYWAFAWLGGQALARYVLDHPEQVRGKRVLDLATGSGLVALAALHAGAVSVLAADIDPLAGEALAANMAANMAAKDLPKEPDPTRTGPLTWTGVDLLDGPVPDVDVVLAGDVLYDRDMTPRVLAFLRRATVPVLLGDPGRDYCPQEGVEEIGSYDLPTTRELEGVAVKRTRVLRLG